MTDLNLLGLLLLAFAAAATWLERRTTTVRVSLLVWIAYVASLCGGTILLVP
jgi:hypothetical protein